MSNTASLREEEIQAIMRFPPALRTSFLQALAAENASPPTQPLSSALGPEVLLSSNQQDPEDAPSQDKPNTLPRIGAEAGPISPPAPATPLQARGGKRPQKRKRIDSPLAPLPPSDTHQEKKRAEPSTPPAPADFQSPCRRCYIKNKPCVLNVARAPGKTSLRCRECYERHRKCEPRLPGDVPEVERQRTPSPALTTPVTPRLVPKRGPAATMDTAPDSHRMGAQRPPSLDTTTKQVHVGTPTTEEIATRIYSLQSDFTNALAEQRNVNTAILKALHCLIERTETTGTKEEG